MPAAGEQPGRSRLRRAAAAGLAILALAGAGALVTLRLGGDRPEPGSMAGPAPAPPGARAAWVALARDLATRLASRPAPGGPPSGWIVDAADAPIEGATISVRGADGATRALAVTDAAGAFRLTGGAHGDGAPGGGEAILVVEGPGVFPAEFTLRADGGAPRVVVTRQGELLARVIRDEAPVADAEVSLSDGSGPLRVERSDDRGLVRLGGLLPGPYELWAHDGVRVSALARVELGARNAAPSVDLALEPGTAVRVRLRAAGSLAGATVSLVPIDVDHAVRAAPVEASGQVLLGAVPRGRWQVEVEARGHVATEAREVDARGDEAEVEVTLVRTGVVAGRVIDAEGRPVERATLVLRGDGPDTRADRRPAAPAASAGLRWVHPLAGVRRLPPNEFCRFGAPREGARPTECGQGHCGVDVGHERGSVVHAAADGVVVGLFPTGRGRAGRYVALEHAGALRTFYIHLDDLRPDLALGTRVAAGEPIGTLGRTGLVRSAAHLHFALAQELDGRQRFLDAEPILEQAVVLPAPRSLEAYAAGALGGAVPAGDAARIDRGDDARPTVIARLRPGAGALPGAPAERRDASATATTGADGRFRLDDVAPGAYVAVAFHATLAPATSASFTMRSGGTLGEVTIVLARGVVVRGEVRDARGPIGGAIVEALEGEGEMMGAVGRATTDADGRYELRPLAGALRLAASAPGHGLVERPLLLGTGGRGAPDRREDFELPSEDAALLGLVLDEAGFPVRGASVRVVDGPGGGGRRATTDAHGRFELAGLPAGRYEVELSSSAHPPTRRTLGTDTRAELTVPAGARLRLRATDAHTYAPLTGVEVEARGPDGAIVRARTGAAGEVELAPLLPGRWRLRAEAAGYAASERTCAVAAGEDGAEERLELARGATLAGVVLDAHGERVPGARVSSGGVSTSSAADGSFRLADVPTGDVEIVATHGERRGLLAARVRPGDELVTLQVELGAE